MKLNSRLLTKLRASNTGQTMTEYSLILFFVGLAVYSAFSGLGQGIKTFTNTIISFISAAVASL